MPMQSQTPTRWFGFTQDGKVIYVGTHATIDEADNTPLGYGCTWLWRESDLLDLSRQIACALYPGPERRNQV